MKRKLEYYAILSICESKIFNLILIFRGPDLDPVLLDPDTLFM